MQEHLHIFITDIFTMRRSPLRHPLAVLRNLIGIGQKELAQLVGKSTATIQAVELGKLPLSGELAMRISDATGVTSLWLLNGDVNAPPVDRNQQPYTRQSFVQHRADLENPLVKGPFQAMLGNAFLASYAARLKFAGAAAQTKKKWGLFLYHLLTAIDSLEEEFGSEKDDQALDQCLKELKPYLAMQAKIIEESILEASKLGKEQAYLRALRKILNIYRALLVEDTRRFVRAYSEAGQYIQHDKILKSFAKFPGLAESKAK